MTDPTAELIPFHALNEFMRSDYRLHVVRTTLSALPSLPDELRAPVERLIKKLVHVPGFRNSGKAPARVKAVPTAEAFEKNPELVAAVLAAWSEVNTTLREQVYDLLKSRGWHLFPLEAHRHRLPGFFIRWPKSEDFETLNQQFSEIHPDAKASSDDVTLMVVWMGMRLPYQIVEESPEVVTELPGLEKFERPNGDEQE